MSVSLTEQAFRFGGNFPLLSFPHPLNCWRRPQIRGGWLAALPQCGSTAVLADLTIAALRRICCCCYCCLCHPEREGEREREEGRERERKRERERERERERDEEIMGSNSPRYLLAQHFLQFIYLFIYFTQPAISAVIQE